MSEPFENLAERIRDEVSDLDEVLDRAGHAWQLVQQGPPEQYAYVDSVALSHGAPDALTIRLFWQNRDWPIIDVPTEIITAYEPAPILDPGEIEVLALGQTLSNVLMLMDDEVARAEARRLKLRLRGTVGVLVQAYRQGHLTYAQIDLLLQEIAVRPDIWISAKLCQQVLEAL